jgi:hypothetical protein
MSRQSDWRYKKQAEGKCAQCGLPGLATKWICETCRRKERLCQAVFRARKKKEIDSAHGVR